MVNWVDEAEKNILHLANDTLSFGSAYDLQKSEGNLVLHRDVRIGNVSAIAYWAPGWHDKYRGAVLCIPAISVPKYGFGVLAERLAILGYYVVAMDLRGHASMKEQDLTLGGVVEDVRTVVKYLEHAHHRIGIVGHSIGAIAAMYATFGYTMQMEHELHEFWKDFEHLVNHIEREVETLRKKSMDGHDASMHLHEILRSSEIAVQEYARLKAILKQAYHNARELQNVKCLVMLAPVMEMKNVFPVKPMKVAARVIGALTGLGTEHIARGMAKDIDLLQLLVPKEERDRVGMTSEWRRQAKQGMFAPRDFMQFVDYLINLKEPHDFIGLLKAFSRLPGDMQNFASWYFTNFIRRTPKLFVYGTWDLGVSSVNPFRLGRKREHLEQYYHDLGATKIVSGGFTHALKKPSNAFDLKSHVGPLILQELGRERFSGSEYERLLQLYRHHKGGSKRYLKILLDQARKEFRQDVDITNEVYKFLRMYVG